MIREKSQEAGYDGYVTLSNEETPHDQFCAIIDERIAKMYAKYRESLIDARGLLAYGIIHCKTHAKTIDSSLKERQEALDMIFKMLGPRYLLKNTSGDPEESVVKMMLNSIVWLATFGDLEMGNFSKEHEFMVRVKVMAS